MVSNVADQKTIERVVSAVIKDRFPNEKIVSLHVSKDTDFEGDPVLVIRVVVDKARSLDAKKASGVVRHVRSKLAEIGENAFPLFSFISKGDVARAKTEAA